MANRWMCQYPWGKNTGVRTMVQTGGKLTCRNSRTARNDSDQLGLDPVVIHVSQPLLESLACCGRPRPRVAIAGPNRSGCGRHPPRVATRRRPATCACRSADKIPYRGVNPAHKIPPRVVIVVSTPGFGTLLVSIPGAAPSSSRYRGVNPADKIPYRPWCNQTPVAIVVQTRGSTYSSCR